MLDPRHGTGVAAADRRHLDDLTFDELDTVLGSQDPGLAHPVILIERETPAPERDRHAVLAVRHCAVPPGGRQCRALDTAAIIDSRLLDSGLHLTQPRGPGGCEYGDH